MAFDWFFKRKFKGNQEQDVNSFQGEDESQDFADRSKDERIHESFDVPFIYPFGTLEDTSHDMFQRMDDMLSRMFSSFGADFFSHDIQKEKDPRSIMLKDPDFDFFSHDIQRNRDPRSIMLKDPDFDSDTKPGTSIFESNGPALLVDSDIDDKVAKHGSLWQTRPEKNFSFKKFSSIRTVRLPDGSVEEHRSMTDSHGNVTTTLRRSIGEQSHEITTHSDAKGVKEKQENYTNLDENDLHDFEKRWQNMRTGEAPSLNMYLKSNEKPTAPIGDPSYSTLFKKFFGI